MRWIPPEWISAFLGNHVRSATQVHTGMVVDVLVSIFPLAFTRSRVDWGKGMILVTTFWTQF